MYSCDKCLSFIIVLDILLREQRVDISLTACTEVGSWLIWVNWSAAGAKGCISK